MAAKVWKELRFGTLAHYHRMEALLSGQRDVERDAVWHFEDGPNVLVTNLSDRTLRRFASMDDIRLPDYVRIPADDPVVVELLETRQRKGA